MMVKFSDVLYFRVFLFRSNELKKFIIFCKSVNGKFRTNMVEVEEPTLLKQVPRFNEQIFNEYFTIKEMKKSEKMLNDRGLSYYITKTEYQLEIQEDIDLIGRRNIGLNVKEINLPIILKSVKKIQKCTQQYLFKKQILT